MASKKISSSMVLSEKWLESYWKSMARIESSNKLLITKKPSGISKYNHWRKEGNPRKDFFKSHKKFWKWLQQMIKRRGHCIHWWKMFEFYNFNIIQIILSFPLLSIFLLIFRKFNLSFSKMSFIFIFCT